MIISGCNSDKNPIFFKNKVATLSLKIAIHLILSISEGFRMSEKETRGQF
jgi:hypothetical protein